MLGALGSGFPGFAQAAEPAPAVSSPSGDGATLSGTFTEIGDRQFQRLTESWRHERRVPALSDIYLSSEKESQQRARSDKARPLMAMPSMMSPSEPLALIRVTSAFGMRHHPIDGGLRMHKGIDLAAAMGAPIHATADGVVREAEWAGGYGRMVAITHPGGSETRYGHMSRFNVVAGQKVRKGDVIGYVGSTGRSTGPHLHYEVLMNGRAIDPERHLR